MSEERTVNVRWGVSGIRETVLRATPLTDPTLFGRIGDYLVEGQARPDLSEPAGILRITHLPSGRALTICANISYRGPTGSSSYARRKAAFDHLHEVVGKDVARALVRADDAPEDLACEAAVSLTFGYGWEGLTQTEHRQREAELWQAPTGAARQAINEWIAQPYWQDRIDNGAVGGAVGHLIAAGLTCEQATTFIDAYQQVQHKGLPARQGTLLGNLPSRRPLDAVDGDIAAMIALGVRSGWTGEDTYHLTSNIPLIGDAVRFGVMGIEVLHSNSIDPQWFALPPRWAALAAAAGLTPTEARDGHTAGALDEDALRFMAGLGTDKSRPTP